MPGICTTICWTPVTCPRCGSQLPPRGRSVPLEMHISTCCDEARRSPTTNPRHLWDVHDSTRYYSDPEGWDEHVQNCEQCRCR